MGLLLTALLIFSIVSSNSWVGHGQTFDLLKYGAKGDGYSDDTKAFMEAWNDLCKSNNSTSTLLVPAGYTFLVREIRFKGPCQSPQVYIQILGTLLAPTRKAWGATCGRHWLYFLGVPGLSINGSGTINGQGQDWWDNINATTGCVGSPTALLFERCDNLQISGLTHINGPGFHMHVVHSQNISISNANINSPQGSHNTDGIDLTNAVRVSILDSIIGTGDDCIAIKGGSQFINVNNVTCGPGHGISVGSLGEDGQEEFVEHVNVSNCIFNGADNAARIKTWPGGKGYAKNITFQNISVNQTYYPVFIDQHYMHTPEQKDALKVSDITFSNIYGRCINENAVVLDCAKIGCDNITLKQINITSIDPKKPASAICNDAHGKTVDIVSPPIPCLLQ